MLRNSYLDEVRPEALSDEGWFVTIDGKIYDPDTGDVPHFRNGAGGIREISITTNNRKKWVSEALLVLSAFKGLNLPVGSFLQVEVLHVDGDVRNNHARNLVWRPPEGGLEVPDRPGFFYIPVAVDYAISLDGKVIRVNDGREVTIGKARYASCGIKSNLGSWITLGIHRALALAFLSYPADVDTLIVNHKDGVTLNNSLDNLEWLTHKGNMVHALSTGLLRPSDITMVEVDQVKRTGSGPAVLIMDVRDSSIWRYPSLTDCALALGLCVERIWSYVNLKEIKIRRKHFLFKYEDDPRPWPEITPELLGEHVPGTPRDVIARNISTGKLVIAESGSALSKIIGVNQGTICFRLRESKVRWPLGEWDVAWFDGKEPEWPVWREDEKAFFSKVGLGLHKPIVAVDEKGGRQYFQGTSEAGYCLGLPSYSINARLRGGNRVKGYLFHVLEFDEELNRTRLREHDKEMKRNSPKTYPTAIVVRKLGETKTLEYGAIIDASRDLGISYHLLQANIRKGLIWPVCGYDAFLKEEFMRWPNWTQKELEFFKTSTVSASPYVTVDEKGNEMIFPTGVALAKFLKVTKCTACSYVRRRKPYKGYRLHRLEFNSNTNTTFLD